MTKQDLNWKWYDSVIAILLIVMAVFSAIIIYDAKSDKEQKKAMEKAQIRIDFESKKTAQSYFIKNMV